MAIDTIARITPEHEHVLLFRGNQDPVDSRLFSEIIRIPKFSVFRIDFVNNVARKTGVDFVHAHSSWAGLWARIVRPTAPVVYQPHCFVFDDPYRSPAIRLLYRVVESALTWRTRSIITLTSHEQRLARKLNRRVSVFRLPNVPHIVPGKAQVSASPVQKVVMVGRLSRQKDPDYFLSVANLVRQTKPDVLFQWIGGGHESYLRKLENAGIQVTGWLSSADVELNLRQSQVYFHSASYEGFPLSVLDACAVGLPVVVRDLDCFGDVDLAKVSSSLDAAKTIVSILDRDDIREEIVQKSHHLLVEMNDDTQRMALSDIYHKEVVFK